jgi:MscS family membrane protein
MDFGQSFIDANPWLQLNFCGNAVWQYLGFLLYTLLAFFLSKAADLLVSNYLKRLAARTATEWDDVLLEVLHGPLKLVVFIFFMHLGIQLMNKPGWLEVWLARSLGVIIAIAVTYVLVKLVDAGFEISRKHYTAADTRTNVQILVMIRKALKVFIIITAVLVTADNNGVKITSVLAGLGVTGLAVALAAQETLSNLLGSIVILADRPFVVGDRIKIGADEGVVEYIGVRSTRLRGANGEQISIPNRAITAASVLNYTATRKPAPPA